MTRPPTAMPMIVPVDSSVGLSGSGGFGDRIAGTGGLAVGTGTSVAWVKSDDMAFEVVVGVIFSDSDDVVTAWCSMTVMRGPTARLTTLLHRDSIA